MGSRPRHIRPLSEAEEARIQKGISLDPDNPELTDDQLARMRPAIEVLPAEFFDAIDAARRVRGRPRVAKPKKLVTLRLDQEVIDKFEATGTGWRARINEVLKAAKL
jgi:uncharacterized protein (DUF4415 family)